MEKRLELPFTLHILGVLLVSSAVSMSLMVIRFIATNSLRMGFLPWNMILAWLPLLFALGLRLNLAKRPIFHWQNIGLLVLWLGFLPNSFYIVSDLIHLQTTDPNIVLYDAAMLLSFILNGLILGYISVYIVHQELLKRFKSWQVSTFLGFVFLCCGFAIYLGRYLRWNTWDILLNPAGLLFDLSDRVINPLSHGRTYTVTFIFALLIGSVYWVVYELTNALSTVKND